MRTLLAALALLLVVPAAARADAVSTGSSAPVRSLALLGDGRPVWAEAPGVVRAVTVGPDGKRLVLATDAPRADDTYVRPEVRADGTDAALVVGRWSCESCKGDPTLNGSTIHVGPAGGPLPRKIETDAVQWSVRLASGRIGVWQGLTDLATGAFTRFPVAVSELQLAGGVVASKASGTGGPEPLIVSEVATGKELYRLPPGSPPVTGLQPDGTALLGTSSTYAIASPAAPVARALPPTVLGPAILAGDRITGLSGRELAVHDLAGTPIARRTLSQPELPFAFDGTTVAWTEERCGLTFVLRWRIGEAGPRVPPGRCTLPAVRGVTADENGVHVALRCPATSALGCVADFGADVRVTRPGRRPGAERQLAQDEARLAPGERGTVDLIADRALPRRRTLEVRVTRDSKALKLRRVRVRAAP